MEWFTCKPSALEVNLEVGRCGAQYEVASCRVSEAFTL